MFSLQGKIALVTGASRGIGRAAALAFASAGADVAITSRKQPDLDRVRREIEGAGRKCLAVPSHAGRIDQVSRLVEVVTGEFGRIDILVNNAATSPAMVPAIEAEERVWDAVMAVNLKGLFFLSQAVARVMREKGGGVIINVASIDAFRPDADLGIYAISKAGVVMATKVMAREWAAYSIRVNAIAPGHVRTRLTDSFDAAAPGILDECVRRTPLGRIAEAREMAGTMIYLASDASRFVTGHAVVVDGGITLT